MSNQSLVMPEQHPADRQGMLAPMRALTSEELVHVVGGPEIKNGGGGLIVAEPIVTSTNG
jgi:hypothetical protein